MGLLGHEIVQSRTYIDPTIKPPDLNYKYTFPITVFDAVRRDMFNEDSETLTQVLEKINQALQNRQLLIPAKPANYLMTYGGSVGAVGSIKLSTEIPWNEEDQSNDRVPTEKAVGDLFRKLGIDPANLDDSSLSVRWSDIIARPNIYNSLGSDDNGLISQSALTKILKNLTSKMDTNDEKHTNDLAILKTRMDNHVSDENNPHHITLSSIGAASASAFEDHINERNPHSITAAFLGLGRVDNTSDKDKPISDATQAALDHLMGLLDSMTDDVGGLNFVVDVKYNADKATLQLIYRNGSTLDIESPLGKSIRKLTYDQDKKEIVMIHNDDSGTRLSLADLYIRYIGSVGPAITVEIEGDQVSGNQTIKAVINPKGIKSTDIADHAVIGRTIKDQAVSTGKIQDLSITTIKYADRSITSQKIDRFAVDNENIADKAVNGRTLFSANDDYRILATLKAGSSPVWTQVLSDMIGPDSVQTRHIAKGAVTYDKLANGVVDSAKITDGAITSEKLADDAVTTEKIKERSITSDLLAEDLMLEGKARLRNTPNDSADDNQIADTRWVRKFAKEDLIVQTSNIAPNAVTGDKLFSSQARNRVLRVTTPGTNPEWGTVNNDMMEDNSVGTSNIIDRSVVADKLADMSVEERHLNRDSVKTSHVQESAITSEKIFTSNEANRVLAALTEDGHPVYSQVTREMLAPNAVDTDNVKDGSLTPSKMQSSSVGQQVLGVGLKGSLPEWTKVKNPMIADRAVDGTKLFTSEHNSMILGVTNAGYNPAWVKVVGDMIADRTIQSRSIAENGVKAINIDNGAIESRHLAPDAVTMENVKDNEISPAKIQTSPIPGRVLAVTGLPYSTPMWSQVTTEMIEDKAVSRDKLFRSNYPYRVLAATQAGLPPEYTMISHHFIVDGTIIPQKLERNFVLMGTPELTAPPDLESNDLKLANTEWVRTVVDHKIVEFLTGESIEGWPPKFDFDDIPEHGIDGSKLFTHPYAPRVLGITAPNDEVEFILIEEDLIVNGAVTTNKLQRDITLLGAPKVEVRPSPNASDADGNGSLIPDCQWVLNRIKDAIDGTGVSGDSSGSTTVAIIPQGSVTTAHLQNRAVTSEKFFSSTMSNRLLGVLDANGAPTYLRANNEMIGDRAVDGRTLFSSDEKERLLGVHAAGGDPQWTQATAGMISDDAIENRHISDRAITENQIETGAVTTRTLFNGPVVDETRLFDAAISKEKIKDNAVINEKIADYAVSTTKLQDKAVTSEKLSDGLVLPGETTVRTTRNYEQRSIRNVIISPKRPQGGRNGDIWFRFS